jgi:hypothetical protein
MVAPNAPFDITQEYADVINALLPTCAYVVGIRKNDTGEVRLCPQTLEWNENSLLWWSTGNMGCDCNRDMEFIRQDKDVDWGDLEPVRCGEFRYTVVGIWFPDGSSIRDLNYLNDF